MHCHLYKQSSANNPHSTFFHGIHITLCARYYGRDTAGVDIRYANSTVDKPRYYNKRPPTTRLLSFAFFASLIASPFLNCNINHFIIHLRPICRNQSPSLFVQKDGATRKCRCLQLSRSTHVILFTETPSHKRMRAASRAASRASYLEQEGDENIILILSFWLKHKSIK